MKKEKVLEKIIRFGKSRTNFRYLAIILCFLWLAFYYFTAWMFKKRYKMMYASSVCIIVLLTGSFAYPIKTVASSEIQGETIESAPHKADDYMKLIGEGDAANGTSVEAELNTSDGEKVVEFYQHPDWNLILINKEHPIDSSYKFELKKIKGSYMADARVVDSVIGLLDAAKEEGVTLMMCSAYRDYNKQVELFTENVKILMKKGYTYRESFNKVAESLTIPGTSEHQAGLAVDIVTPRYQMLNDGFGNTEAGKWLAANCYKYGFILRYPQGKQEITGITYEPWHFRYVGVQAATEITLKGICLEEYLEQWRDNN